MLKHNGKRQRVIGGLHIIIPIGILSLWISKLGGVEASWLG